MTITILLTDKVLTPQTLPVFNVTCFIAGHIGLGTRLYKPCTHDNYQSSNSIHCSFAKFGNSNASYIQNNFNFIGGSKLILLIILVMYTATRKMLSTQSVQVADNNLGREKYIATEGQFCCNLPQVLTPLIPCHVLYPTSPGSCHGHLIGCSYPCDFTCKINTLLLK